MKQASYLLLLSAIALVSVGCSQPFVITHPLEQQFPVGTVALMGDIQDELPPDMSLADRPTSEDIYKMRTCIQTEIFKEGVFQLAMTEQSSVRYTIVGSLLEYKKGSGVARFLIGFGAGNAKTTLSLKVVDNESGSVVFAASLSETISSGMEKGDKAYERIGKNFAKALKKEMKRLAQIT